MGELLRLATVSGFVVVNLVMGAFCTWIFLPKMWERARAIPDIDRVFAYSPAGSVNLRMFVMAFFWFVAAPSYLFMSMANHRDPDRLERELESRDKKIAELEQKLEIG